MQIVYPQPWQQKFEHLKINDEIVCGDGYDSDDSTYDSDDSMGSEYDEAEAQAWWEDFNRKRSEKSKQVALDFLQQVEKNQIAEFPWPPPDPTDCGPYKYIKKYLKSVKFQEDELELARKFLDQVKSSWGYDVDCSPPRWVPTSDFQPMDIDEIKLDSPQMSKILNSTANSVIHEINTVAEAEKMSKRFELVRIVKAVFVGGIKAAFLLTLTIKEVELDIEKTVRAMVSRPPVHGPKLVECKLISSTLLG